VSGGNGLDEQERDGLVVVTLDRPERMNALNREMVLELGELGRRLDGDRAVRAVVVTGAGKKAFCAGADLKERRGMSDEDVRAMIASYRTELAWLDTIGVPVIAAINGVCLGGGLEIALGCDLRVAAPEAQLGLPETSLGIIPGAGGTQRLPRIIGQARAKEMILLARRIVAAEALAWGLVNRVSPAGTSVVDDTLEWIRPIVDGAPLAQTAALTAIDAAANATVSEGMEVERRQYEICLTSDDRVEALRAFAEKRRPVFKGR
jgi:enoyl-CoA hydratase/carnithine racemase